MVILIYVITILQIWDQFPSRRGIFVTVKNNYSGQQTLLRGQTVGVCVVIFLRLVHSFKNASSLTCYTFVVWYLGV